MELENLLKVNSLNVYRQLSLHILKNIKMRHEHCLALADFNLSKNSVCVFIGTNKR